MYRNFSLGLIVHLNSKSLTYLLYRYGLSWFYYTSELITHLYTGRILDSYEHPELFEFDHIYSDLNIAGPVAILYGALGTECFKEFHVALIDASKQV